MVSLSINQLGVEVLQGNSDNRYKYFNNKIQGLMNKKHIIEELHLASTGRKADKEILKQVNKIEIEKRKNQYDIQKFLNSDQCDIKKIR